MSLCMYSVDSVFYKGGLIMIPTSKVCWKNGYNKDEEMARHLPPWDPYINLTCTGCFKMFAVVKLAPYIFYKRTSAKNSLGQRVW